MVTRSNELIKKICIDNEDDMTDAADVILDLTDYFRDMIDGDDPVENVRRLSPELLEVQFESGSIVQLTAETV